uniref:probable BOI-related E3 ubiquitin-protein ligase 2 n=1 Tax=Erigeron canadensis TaxID=72917 RepID=UPI001CB911F9|nr:probable BOI-related E3 ubiquitin-protein ligase 2 [Erigeron canadensis]
MAVQAQLYSDNFYQNNNNNNMGFSNLPQDWVLMSSGSSLFDENKPFSSSFEYHHQQQDQRLLDMNSSDYLSRRNGNLGYQNLSSELERQRLEMDCFLHFQNEKLKAVLNEETRKREILLMQTYESKMMEIMDKKDEVLNRATNRTRELQNHLLIAEHEAKNWEKKAIESEAIVTDLSKKLSQIIERKHEDAESVCNGGDNDNGNEDDQHEQQRQRRMVCKMCHVRSSCVLLLPCRHLCCCRDCESLLRFCPVCGSVKKASLEVFFV